MAIKRLSREELIARGKEIFYNDMIYSDKLYLMDNKTIAELSVSEKLKTPVDLLHDDHIKTVEENQHRIEMYNKYIEENQDNHACLEALQINLDKLLYEREVFLNTNLVLQKKLYKKTGKIDYTTNQVLIPLNKHINSLYDDFYLLVCFHDDVGILNGCYSTYQSLETNEERLNFFKSNTEVICMALCYYRRNQVNAIIGVLGNINTKNTKLQNLGVSLLDLQYSNFRDLTLADLQKIRNNDLRQFLQSKIDLDKEGLTLVFEKYIGNDLYSIYTDLNNKHVKTAGLNYIRYTCPSTGRVYYNELNTTNLRISKYYKEGSPENWIDSWWSINNLGANPYNKKAMIRC